MAVVQISRIQVRRGKSKETGIPQLASGEIAWALDTQQLYIGNGSVAEGAPAVGNTKILTENDLNGQGNFLDLVQYIYKVGDDTIQTGSAATIPVARFLQDRLDDRVILTDFITQADKDSNDYTASIQRAIDQLFFNPALKASHSTLDYLDGVPDAVKQRVVLELPAGVFNITDTLYVPSYATLVGAGKNKTVIEFSGTGPAIQFVNDTSSIGSPDSITNSLYTTQPRFITLSNFTIYTKTATQTALQMDCVRDSIFENLVIKGDWNGIYSNTSVGVALNVFSSVVTCERNSFKNVDIFGFEVAVYAPQDVLRNTFETLYINKVNDGIILGARYFNENSLQNSFDGVVGEENGPQDNIVTNSIFGDATNGIARYALYIGKGKGNSVVDSRIVNVGNGPSGAQYPQVFYYTPGNTIKNVSSDRTNVLSKPSSTVPYISEVSGTIDYQSHGTFTVNLGSGSSVFMPAFKLPVSCDQYGIPRGKNSFNINYIYNVTSGDNFVRQGTLFVSVDPEHGVVQLADEYNFAGVNNTSELILDFRAKLLDATNNYITDINTQTVASVVIEYANTLSIGELHYSYSSSTFGITDI